MSLTTLIEKATQDYNDLVRHSKPLPMEVYVFNLFCKKHHTYFDTARQVNETIGWRGLKENTIEYELEHLTEQ